MSKISDAASLIVLPADAIAAASAQRRDAEATLERYQQVIEILRTRVVCAGWQLDEAGAARTLSFFQGLVHGREDESDFEAARWFLRQHGQSLDWIFDGDIFGLICEGARHSAQASLGTEQ